MRTPAAALGLDNPRDTLDYLAAVLDFLAESLSNSAALTTTPFSGRAVDGLASICTLLSAISSDESLVE